FPYTTLFRSAVAVTGGGGGVGSASAGSAAAAAAGAAPGRGASCANANPRAQVASAVTAKRREAAVDLIELGTPVVRSSVAGRGGDAHDTARTRWRRNSLIAHDLGHAQAEAGYARGQFSQRGLAHRAHAHAPQGAAGAGHVLHPGLGDARAAQRGKHALGVV